MTTIAAPDVKTEYPHIVWRPGVVGGRPRIEGTRLPVWQIVLACQKGSTVTDLVDTYSSLTPAAIHSALAYYWDHKEDVDEEIASHQPERMLTDLQGRPSLVEEQPGVFRGRSQRQSDSR